MDSSVLDKVNADRVVFNGLGFLIYPADSSVEISGETIEDTSKLLLVCTRSF